jgi:hypothetical protein
VRAPLGLVAALLVVRLAERVRTAIQKSLDEGVAQRKSVWFG